MSCGRCPDSASSILSDPQPSLGLRDLDAQEVAGALSSVPDGTSGAHSWLCLVGRRVAEEMAPPPPRRPAARLVAVPFPSTGLAARPSLSRCLRELGTVTCDPARPPRKLTGTFGKRRSEAV